MFKRQTEEKQSRH